MTADNVLFEIKGLKKNFGDLEVLKGSDTVDAYSIDTDISHWTF